MVYGVYLMIYTEESVIGVLFIARGRGLYLQHLHRVTQTMTLIDYPVNKRPITECAAGPNHWVSQKRKLGYKI